MVNESCSSGESIWYGDSEIAIASTDAGEWPNAQLWKMSSKSRTHGWGAGFKLYPQRFAPAPRNF